MSSMVLLERPASGPTVPALDRPQDIVTLPRMMLRVTGRFELGGGSGTVNVSGRLQRALLALLTLRRHNWAPSEALIDALWVGQAPRGLDTRLHLQVHRLRRRLGTDVIESGPDGYRLDLADGEVDVWRFEELVADALVAPAGGAASCGALQRLDDAVAQWGGDPFPDVELPDVVAERHRLQELYLAAQERRAEHLLDLGEDRAALDAVTSVAAENLTREHLQVLRMDALRRLGRRTQVLEVFENARTALEDMGLEPGPELLRIRSALGDTPGSGPLTSPPDGTRVPVDARDDPESFSTRPSAREDELRRTLAGHRHHDQDNAHRRELAFLLAGRGELDEALELLGHAEADQRVHGQDDARAGTLRDMAAVVCLIGDLQRALRLLAEAAELHERTTGTDTMVRIVRALVLTHLGRLEEAQQWLDVAGRPRTEIRSSGPAGIGAVVPGRGRHGRAGPDGPEVRGRDEMWWRVRSQVDRRRGHPAEAVRGAQEAYRRALQEPHLDPAPVRVELAAALRDAGDAECFTWYGEAIDDAREKGRLPIASYAHASVAKAWLMWDDPQRAAAHGSTGLHLARRSGCWIFAARAASRIADAQARMGRSASADWYRREALSFYRRVDHPLPAAAREHLEGRPVGDGPDTDRQGRERP